ncbi:MAG: hypothetical protein HUJ72_03680 [Blautia sp.]|nr:hypothetical protein [Blautia sp.]
MRKNPHQGSKKCKNAKKHIKAMSLACVFFAMAGTVETQAGKEGWKEIYDTTETSGSTQSWTQSNDNGSSGMKEGFISDMASPNNTVPVQNAMPYASVPQTQIIYPETQNTIPVSGTEDVNPGFVSEDNLEDAVKEADETEPADSYEEGIEEDGSVNEEIRRVLEESQEVEDPLPKITDETDLFEIDPKDNPPMKENIPEGDEKNAAGNNRKPLSWIKREDYPPVSCSRWIYHDSRMYLTIRSLKPVQILSIRVNGEEKEYYWKYAKVCFPSENEPDQGAIDIVVLLNNQRIRRWSL